MLEICFATAALSLVGKYGFWFIKREPAACKCSSPSWHFAQNISTPDCVRKNNTAVPLQAVVWNGQCTLYDDIIALLHFTWAASNFIKRESDQNSIYSTGVATLPHDRHKFAIYSL
ncbi:unnamed protein product [Ectocarpus sp. 8 AP-2014]